MKNVFVQIRIKWFLELRINEVLMNYLWTWLSDFFFPSTGLLQVINLQEMNSQHNKHMRDTSVQWEWQSIYFILFYLGFVSFADKLSELAEVI